MPGVLGVETWLDALIALIIALPSTVAAIFAGMVAVRTKTPNGTRIGQTVVDTREIAAQAAATLTELNGSLSATKAKR